MIKLAEKLLQDAVSMSNVKMMKLAGRLLTIDSGAGLPTKEKPLPVLRQIEFPGMIADKEAVMQKLHGNYKITNDPDPTHYQNSVHVPGNSDTIDRQNKNMVNIRNAFNDGKDGKLTGYDSTLGKMLAEDITKLPNNKATVQAVNSLTDPGSAASRNIQGKFLLKNIRGSALMRKLYTAADGEIPQLSTFSFPFMSQAGLLEPQDYALLNMLISTKRFKPTPAEFNSDIRHVFKRAVDKTDSKALKEFRSLAGSIYSQVDSGLYLPADIPSSGVITDNINKLFHADPKLYEVAERNLRWQASPEDMLTAFGQPADVEKHLSKVQRLTTSSP